jgi:RND family efflux transporter MFP subunit
MNAVFRSRFLFLMVLALFAGCTERNAYVPPPPPQVVVVTPEVRSVTAYHEFPATTQASELVQLRSRVQGYLERINFQDGTTVSQGHLLFVIDPRPYQAQLDAAVAAVESAKATAVQTETVYKRTLALIPSQAATREEAETQRGNWLVAKASIQSAEAKVREAKLIVEYTQITAPISGRIGRRLVDIGNLISADSTVLATITRYDPMYVYFNATEAQFLDYLKRLREHPRGTLEATRPSNPRATGAAMVGSAGPPLGVWEAVATQIVGAPNYPIELALPNEKGFPHRGTIDFADNMIDPNTGTLLARAVFANPEPYYVAPGMFVRVHVPIQTRPNAVLVPDSAVGTDQAGRYLLVVGKDDVAQRRGVTVGTLNRGMRVIEEGLHPGERFIVEGLQHARPGMKVNPVSPSHS